MKSLAALLVLRLLSGSSDGGEPDGGTLYEKCGSPGAPAVQLDGGSWLMPGQRADWLACNLAATREHRDELLAQNQELRADPSAPGWKTWLIACAILMTASFVGGLVVKK